MSTQYTLSKEDKVKWGKNALSFLKPLILLYTGSVALMLNDGLQMTDLYINSLVAGAMLLYVLNVINDLLNKFTAGN